MDPVESGSSVEVNKLFLAQKAKYRIRKDCQLSDRLVHVEKIHSYYFLEGHLQYWACIVVCGALIL